MEKPQSAIIRHLLLLWALACVTACATSANLTGNSSDNGTVVASSDAAQPPVVLKGTGVAGETEAGEKVYCRRTTEPGSRLIKSICMTEEQRRKQQEHVAEVFKNTGRRSLKSGAGR